MIVLILILAAAVVIAAIANLRSGDVRVTLATPPPEGDAAVAALAKEGKIIEAVKLYREAHDCDLTTAKIAIDKLLDR